MANMRERTAASNLGVTPLVREDFMSLRILARTALVFVATLLLLLASACGDDRTARVDALFERWDRSDSPGCGLGIVRDGSLIYERGYGMANLEHHIPITPATIFRIASTSKQFAATSILLLEQDGALSLDDDIRKYLPAMPDYGHKIALRHLMRHSSGIRDYAEIRYLMGFEDDDRFIEQEVLDLLARQKALNFTPGDRYLYSNSGYLMLGEIIERVSGGSLRQFAKERIFGPLGMHDSYFRDDYTEIVENRAAGYAPREGGGFRMADSPFDLVGDGSLFTTVRDLFLWDQNFYHHEIGGETLADRQHETLVLNDGREMQYAAGLEIGTYGGLRFVAHSGSWVGFGAQLLRFPEQRFSVICLCNDESAEPTALALRIADIYLGDRFDVPPRRPASADRDEAPILGTDELVAIEGLYREPVTHGVARVTVGDSTLRVDRGWGESEFAPIDRTTFRSTDPDAGIAVDLVFEESRREELERFQLLQFGEVPLNFEKVEPFTPSLELLRDYTGTYYSEELQTTHGIVLEGDRLYAKYRNAPQNPLEPTVKDQFTLDETRIEFERDAQGAVSGFAVWFDWSWDLRFARIDD